MRRREALGRNGSGDWGTRLVRARKRECERGFWAKGNSGRGECDFGLNENKASRGFVAKGPKRKARGARL